ncbi:MAG: DUF2520 domain-containing protein [Ignavibacteriales bacterium]|nr:DUF2520 domain-containing protein [Ignavibacteriales bacterium]
MKPITIIGAGAVGHSIALALFYGGVKIDGIYSLRGKTARALSKKVKARISGPISALSDVSERVILCVPDKEIASVATILTQQCRSLKSRIVLHTSGAHSSSELLPVKIKGASIGSFHPMQTFPANKRISLKGVWCAVEGERSALKFAKQLAKIFHAQTFTISKEEKVLYHAAGVFASNYLVTLLSVVERIAIESGIQRKNLWKIYGNIIRQTLENVLSSSPAEALTGPIARGDVETVAGHLEALSGKKLNYLVPLYSALGIETARLARKKKIR